MCGIFGVISPAQKINKADFRVLSSAARQRGRDASGLILMPKSKLALDVYRSDGDINRLRSRAMEYDAAFAFGHSRLITSGETDNQPIIEDDVCVLHNGLAVCHFN